MNDSNGTVNISGGNVYSESAAALIGRGTGEITVRRTARISNLFIEKSVIVIKSGKLIVENPFSIWGIVDVDEKDLII